ncbi:threonine aldolase family protein [Actinomyces minihominis]|uniref:threonine aldolase family protein n=1 Tax=Actinomyces minihominis TaxID=2002838 RepID=UPI000C07A999|nr:low specificity L-threonine aldolase [Actinomyces minihominis]
MTQTSTSSRNSFASDNYSGVHPQILTAIAKANVGHASSYGEDEWTGVMDQMIREVFGDAAEGFPVFNGTGANVVSLQSVLPRWGAVIAPSTAHINNDEGGAPEKVGALKILGVPTPDGKLTPELAKREAWGWGDPHRSQPLAISISQVTELGTCYTPAEVRALADFAHSHDMALHMDGARLSNAAAHMGTTLRELTTDAGVDVLSLGGTKNGAMGAEAVVVLNPERATGLPYLRKTNMQLGSKMRFVSAQLTELFGTDLWQRLAQHSNEMAARLHSRLNGAVPIPVPVESNGVFAMLTPEQKERARAVFHFYDWPGDPDLVRLMCSFDTTVEDVDDLADLIVGSKG